MVISYDLTLCLLDLDLIKNLIIFIFYLFFFRSTEKILLKVRKREGVTGGRRSDPNLEVIKSKNIQENYDEY